MSTFTVTQSLLIILLAAVVTGLIVSLFFIAESQWQLRKERRQKKTMDEYLQHKEEVERKARHRL